MVIMLLHMHLTYKDIRIDYDVLMDIENIVFLNTLNIEYLDK